MGKGQALAQRRANVIGKFERRCARPSFAAINNDEIRQNARLQHGLAQAHKFAGMTNA